MSTVIAQATTADASYEIKMVDGVIFVTAQADLIKTVQDMINKNTSNPFVKIALAGLGTLKSALDWSGVKKDVNV